MADFNALLQVLTLILLGVGGYGLFLLRAGTEAAVRTSAEEAARAAIQQLKWPAELARELQKTRGVERQELRFKSYGALWKELRPLAIYDAAAIDRTAACTLSARLSDWYFSECGGLLLTPQARDFYFALQDLLRVTSKTQAAWVIERPGEAGVSAKETFAAVLEAKQAKGALDTLAYVSSGMIDDWQQAAPAHAAQWRTGVNAVAAAWNELDNGQRFATLQQVGSILRTSLVNDLESRAR
jgi:hypothetical protein